MVCADEAVEVPVEVVALLCTYARQRAAAICSVPEEGGLVTVVVCHAAFAIGS